MDTSTTQSATKIPFFMHGDGFILSEDDLRKYNGHTQIDKFTFSEGADRPNIEAVPTGSCLEQIKQWLRPTKISSEDLERWKTTPALRILMIKTKNEFTRDPTTNTPSHRTIPGCTEVTPHADQQEHITMVREVFRHTRLPLAALGAYVKSHITFLSAPSYEVFGDDKTSGGEVTKYYCSGTSWSIAWSYFHETRHTSAVMFYREGDGVKRRGELEHEIMRLKQHIAHPMLLAYIKTQVSLVWTFHLLEGMNVETFEIEKSIGLATWDWVLDREIEAYRDPNVDNSDSEENIARAQKRAVERYNVLSGKLINIRFRLRSFREQIVWLRRMNSNYLSGLKRDSSLELRIRECHELNTVLDRMDDFSKVYSHDADTLTDRLSQQMSSLSYLITQRDSRISLAIADINNELAWQGKNTNNAMMAIAVASFVFLPATFIAALFDTPIFNWRPLGDSVVVTEPFWIFWLACGSTTGLLCLFWFLYIKRKRASDKIRRRDERREFRKKILRAPSLIKRAKRGAPEAEDVSQQRGWLSFWHWRMGRDVDVEKGVGVGALEAVSSGKSA